MLLQYIEQQKDRNNKFSYITWIKKTAMGFPLKQDIRTYRHGV